MTEVKCISIMKRVDILTKALKFAADNCRGVGEQQWCPKDTLDFWVDKCKTCSDDKMSCRLEQSQKCWYEYFLKKGEE